MSAVYVGQRMRQQMGAHTRTSNSFVFFLQVDSEVHLSASSPDEQAFVAAAELFGYEFVDRQLNLSETARLNLCETVQLNFVRNRAAELRTKPRVTVGVRVA
eukprot:4058950-Pleurochrysis_carterae.AAC.1